MVARSSWPLLFRTCYLTSTLVPDSTPHSWLRPAPDFAPAPPHRVHGRRPTAELSRTLATGKPPRAVFSDNARRTIAVVVSLQTLRRKDIGLPCFGDSPTAAALKHAVARRCVPVTATASTLRRRDDRRPLWWPLFQQREDGVDVEMGGQQVGHRVQLRIAPGRHVDIVGDDETVPP